MDCTQKEPFRTASPTIILKDSIAQPSDSLGHIPNGPEKNLGDKVVFFLHGLGGGVTSWGRANSFTYGNYKTVTSRPVYNQSEDFEIAWVDLNQRFRDVNLDEIQADPDYDRLSSIVIAHSLGGVVTRYIDQKYVTENFQREFGGFATFGGPHAGAPIIDNFNAGLVQEYFDESCNVMSRPYILEFYTELENGIINFLPGSIKA
ncbi:MAG TPA: hypothetical protein ENK52_01550, partial [Saprospiraceae bacterium]|nr:hypothetical protein [Saprospiraceae bacterium]